MGELVAFIRVADAYEVREVDGIGFDDDHAVDADAELGWEAIEGWFLRARGVWRRLVGLRLLVSTMDQFNRQGFALTLRSAEDWPTPSTEIAIL